MAVKVDRYEPNWKLWGLASQTTLCQDAAARYATQRRWHVWSGTRRVGQPGPGLRQTPGAVHAAAMRRAVWRWRWPHQVLILLTNEINFNGRTQLSEALFILLMLLPFKRWKNNCFVWTCYQFCSLFCFLWLFISCRTSFDSLPRHNQ